jgi:hypothetical protein
VLTLLQPWDPKPLFDVEMEGDKARGITDTRMFVPLLGSTARILAFRPRPDLEIMQLTWYSICLPQVIERAIVSAAFRMGKPMYELDSKVGFSLKDYTIMGYA